MKIAVTNGVVTATSQTKREARALIDLALNTGGVQEEVKVHKKHQFKKKCDVCGKECKGKIGIALHKSVSHNQRSVNAEYNKRWREKKMETNSLNVAPYGGVHIQS